MPLTDKAAAAALSRQAPKAAGRRRAAPPRDRRGTKTWRFKCRKDGKEKLLLFGRYPAVTFKAARLARDEAKKVPAAGRDPALEARRLKLVGQGRTGETFEKFAREWRDAQKAR